MTLLNVIWESGDDKGVYIARCERVTDRMGILRLISVKDGQEIRSQSVSLAFGARFGPDISDVHQWNRMATGWADELDNKTQV